MEVRTWKGMVKHDLANEGETGDEALVDEVVG